MDEAKSLSHSKWECKYRVVFIPKCRRRILYEQGHLIPDHVHMLISIPPKYAVSQNDKTNGARSDATWRCTAGRGPPADAARTVGSAPPGLPSPGRRMCLAPPRGRCGGVILVAHGLQLADSRIDRSPAHPQHSRHIRETAKADLQRLDRGVAASLLFRQRTQVDMKSSCD